MICKVLREIPSTERTAQVLAIATGNDKKGKLNLSRKELLLKNKPKKEELIEEKIEEVVDAE